MQESETRSLKRAALVLLAISLVRFGAPFLSPDPVGGERDVLGALGPAAREATSEAAFRRSPLADNEQIDPNRADERTLDRLPGIGPAAAAAIVAARDTGVVFRRPEDLLAVRGIGPASLARIRARLDLRAPPAPPPGRRPGRIPTLGALVDVNRADASALQTLPGVGPAIAERIVASRLEGLFRSLDDLQRVPGIGPATVARLRARATVGPRAH